MRLFYIYTFSQEKGCGNFLCFLFVQQHNYLWQNAKHIIYHINDMKSTQLIKRPNWTIAILSIYINMYYIYIHSLKKKSNINTH